MGKSYDQLDMRFHSWIAAQHIFFVATAPQRRGGHVNLSPKGHADTFAVLDERTVTYLDLTGRGAETRCPAARRRSHHPHVLRLLRPTADPAAVWAGTDRPPQ